MHDGLNAVTLGQARVKQEAQALAQGSRRLVFFALVLLSYSIASRLLAYTLGIPASYYVPLETFGFTARLALEAPHASPRYGWLALLCFVSGLIAFKWPQVRAPLINTVYMLIVIGCVHYRMKAAVSKASR